MRPNAREMSGTPDLGKMVTLLSRYNNSSIKIMIVSLLPAVFVGYHFAQPRGQAEHLVALLCVFFLCSLISKVVKKRMKNFIVRLREQ